MARVSTVALAGAVLLAAGCSSGVAATPTPPASAATNPSTQPVVSSSVAAPSAGPSGAALPGLQVKATVDGVAFPAALVAVDDAVWALGHTDAKWSRIDPATNAITDTVSLGGSYASGGVLADGKLWALDFTDRQVVGVDPAARKVVAKVPVGIDGGWLVGDKTAIWAIGNDSHELIRIDPKTSKVTRFTIDPACGSTPTVGGGSVWLVAGSGHLCKIDPTTGRVVGQMDGVGSPHSMFWGANRIVMPNDEGGAVVVDPAAMTVEAVVPPPPAGTFDGAKYSLSSPETQDSVSMLDAAPAVWVRYTGATVGRLDLSGPPAWTVYAGLPPSNDGAPMLVAFDSFWAADVDGDAVIRADLPR